MHNHQVKNTHEKVVEFYNGFEEVFSLTYYNAKGNVIDRMVSSTVFKLTGYSKKEFELTDFSDLYASKSDRDSLLIELKKEGSVKNKILPLRKKSGELIFVSFSAEIIKDDLPEGCEFALKAILRDVTEFQHEKIRLKIAQLISEKSHKRIVDLNKLGGYIHEVLSTTIYFSNFYIATIDAKAGNTIFHYFKDDISSKEVKTTYFERKILKNGFTEHLIKNSNTIIKDGEGVEKCIVKYKIDMKGAIPTSLVSIPLKNEGISEGVMVFQSYDKKITFSKYDVEFLKLIANQVSDVINRKYWQEKIIENEQYFRSLVDNSSEIIGILNERGVIEYISDSVTRKTGFYPHEVIGNNIVKLIDKEKLFNQVFKKSKQGDKPIVIKIINKDGEKRYLEVSLSFLEDSEFGKRLVFNAKDITSRVIAERKREFAQKRLFVLHQIEQALITDKPLKIVLDEALKIIMENVLEVDRASVSLLDNQKSISKILALRTTYKTKIKIKEGDSIKFKDLTSFTNTIKGKVTIKHDLARLKKLTESDQKNLKEGIKSYFIKPIVIHDNVVGTFNFGSKTKNFFKSVDESLMDEITLLVAVVLNDAIIKKELTGLRDALNNTALMFYTDRNGIILEVNKRLVSESGYSRKELVGSNPRVFSSHYHTKEEWMRFWKKLNSKQAWHGEVRNRRKDGTLYWVFQTITPIIDNKGDIEKFIAIQFNITEERKQKNNLIREVLEAQEKERERFAMEIHDGLGQMLLATKMNLSALKSKVSLLGSDSVDICNTSFDLISNAILEARSISHGLMSRVLNNYGLAYAVNDMINNVNSSDSLIFNFNHNINEKRYDEELEMGVYRTLQELINNTIKHSKAGKAYLSIKEEGNELKILLRDNGVGIKKEVLANAKKGGIGLRNMKSRIEYLGGRLTINDSVKKGTEININIELK